MTELCPFLPSSYEDSSPGDLLHLGSQRDTEFYETALKLTQWYIAKDEYHKALLSLNRASSVLASCCPFEAFDWVLKYYDPKRHFGNPVRHFQHLASRIDQKQQLQVWRAWACFHLAEKNLDQKVYQRDYKQINNEDLAIPNYETVFYHLDELQTSDETSTLNKLLRFPN